MGLYYIDACCLDLKICQKTSNVNGGLQQKMHFYEFFSVGCFVSTLSALFSFRRKLLTSFSVFRFSASFYFFMLSHFTSTFTQKWFFCLVNDTPNHEDRSPSIVSFFSCLSVPFYMLTAPRYNLYLRRCIFKTIFFRTICCTIFPIETDLFESEFFR